MWLAPLHHQLLDLPMVAHLQLSSSFPTTTENWQHFYRQYPAPAILSPLALRTAEQAVAVLKY